MTNRTGIDDAVLHTFTSVVKPALAASQAELQAKHYEVIPVDRCPEGLAKVGLTISRPPAASSVTVAFYWNERDGVYEQDINDSDPESRLDDVPHKTLTPEIVKRAVARAVTKLGRLISESP